MSNFTIDEFKTPLEVKKYLKKYQRFKSKKFISTVENKFYVGTEFNFSGFESHHPLGGYCKSVGKNVRGDVEHVRFRKVGTFCDEVISVYTSLKDLQKDFEPMVHKKERLKLKIGKFELIIT